MEGRQAITWYESWSAPTYAISDAAVSELRAAEHFDGCMDLPSPEAVFWCSFDATEAREIIAIDSQQLTVLVFSPVVLGPGMLVYGLLRAFVPLVPTAAPGSHFGNVLAEADAEQRWRHRLLAIAIAIVHGLVYLAMI